mgnify:CR=1 FL=1
MNSARPHATPHGAGPDWRHRLLQYARLARLHRPIGILLLLWPMSVALTWLVAQSIANRPYDRELGELTREIAGQVAALASPEPAVRQHARAEMDLASRLMIAASGGSEKLSQAEVDELLGVGLQSPA